MYNFKLHSFSFLNITAYSVARIQDFEWGGALRRSAPKRFGAPPQYLVSNPKLTNRWDAKGSGMGR